MSHLPKNGREMPKVRLNGIGANILLNVNDTLAFDNISDNQYLWSVYYYDEYDRDTHNDIQPPCSPLTGNRREHHRD